MLHILLLILKITGIIIAAILGILVLLICVVLFVPGRYDVEASCDGTLSEARARAKLTWFLNLVRLNVCYEKKKLTWKLCIAWKKKQSGREDKKKIKKEVETYDEEMEGLWEDLEESVEEGSEEGAETLEDPKESEEREKLEESAEKGKEKKDSSGQPAEIQDRPRENDKDVEEGKTGADKDVEERKAGADKDMEEGETGADKDVEEGKTGVSEGLEEDERGGEEERKPVWRKIADVCQKIVGKITALYRKIAGIPGKIKDMLGGISGRIEALAEKKNKIVDFISDDVHKTAFLKVKDEGLRLLRKLKPKKFLAKVHYGFDDPCLTGKLLAGISVIYPFLGRDIDIRPDFERQVIEGDLRMTGRIRVSYFARLLWKLFWCKEVRVTYRHVREFEL